MAEISLNTSIPELRFDLERAINVGAHLLRHYFLGQGASLAQEPARSLIIRDIPQAKMALFEMCMKIPPESRTFLAQQAAHARQEEKL